MALVNLGRTFRPNQVIRETSRRRPTTSSPYIAGLGLCRHGFAAPTERVPRPIGIRPDDGTLIWAWVETKTKHQGCAD